MELPLSIIALTRADPPEGGRRRNATTDYQAACMAMQWPLMPAYAKLTLCVVSPFVVAVTLPLMLLSAYLGLRRACTASTIVTVVCFVKLLLVHNADKRPRKIRTGLHFLRTERNDALVSKLTTARQPYQRTWWLCTGDLLTLYPFMDFAIDTREPYIRRWLETDDGEHIALDWALPAGGFDPRRPVMLILHGLNGGSEEGYCVDLVKRAVRSGYTVVVMVARGLMSTSIQHGNFFNGARISDVHKTVDLLSTSCDGAPIVAVGFSMGGTILNNYVAQTAQSCPFQAAVSISGCFDTVKNIANRRSRELWQPFLAFELKKNLFLPHIDLVAARKDIDTDVVKAARDIYEFDKSFVVPYYKYRDLVDYYEDMSASCRGKHANIARPLLALHAYDDPVIDADTLPGELPVTNENVFLLVTPTGGHVGWPTGTWPKQTRWDYMCMVALDFFGAVASVAKQEHHTKE